RIQMRIELLHKKHNRNDFDCGQAQLNHYLKTQASQDVKKKLAICYILVETNLTGIIGFYTLSTNSISRNHFPEDIQKKLPYPKIPTILLGRLAIDVNHQGKGMGKILLVDALKRCFESTNAIGSFAIVVDPIDAQAEKFYEKYGFIRLPDSHRMFIPMKTVIQLFADNQFL